MMHAHVQIPECKYWEERRQADKIFVSVIWTGFDIFFEKLKDGQ